MVLACERLRPAASPLNRNKEESKMITITATVGTSTCHFFAADRL
jgi:hypothetical protein